MSRLRALVALLAASTAFVLQTGTSRAAIDDTFNPDCPAATALPQVTGKVLDFTGTLTCFRPGGSRAFGTNVAPANTQVRSATPQLGDPCRNVFNHPVTFSEDSGGNPKAIFAGSGNTAPGSRPLSPADAAMMGTHDAYVTDVQLGSYEPSNPSNPSSPLTCVIDPTYRFYCPQTGVLDDHCYTWVLHAIPGAAPLPRDLAPFFGDRIARLQTQAGEIRSAPSAKGVVNTSTCFWIDNMGVPQEQDLMLVLPGPVDASGRQVFYTLFARIQFLGVTWNFDEPSGDSRTARVPDACAGRPEVVAHEYTRISDERNPDGKYHVTATESYSIGVVVYWIDSDGPHGPIGVDPGVSAPTLTPNVYPQYVGQVEGVPIGGQ